MSVTENNIGQGTLRLYFRKPPEKDRYFRGDRFIRPFIRRAVRGNKVGGVEKVFINLCKGLDKLGVSYTVNSNFSLVSDADKIVVLGTGRHALEGYNRPNPIVAGIGLMTHPSEWPTLCQEFPVVKYLQHSEWATHVYIPYFGKAVCECWPAGIDTEKWMPRAVDNKEFDILIYNKIRWDKDALREKLVTPVKESLAIAGISYKEIIYGSYHESDYHSLLRSCRAMIFLCEHESQGIACCEAMAMNIPVYAWDNGFCLDPNRFKWNDPVIPATSVPFFDERCGDVFKNVDDFTQNFGSFYARVKSGQFQPREYVLENLTLEKSALKMLELITAAQL